ncbi:PadR family transcriptional regulator [Paenibacillus gallinarum]|uniref:PadR family transcriptional regulator n=1 Tax=Paenibacillus gallinarum TaxID=2762232 RepID=A0ABR8SZD9_9BACL|nr:PadR family transcriptional regulator [Paenibacillus gallinarum]MBD7968444.1 PadR family transcriptional regulator [Paenibacillus gallinarum]
MYELFVLGELMDRPMHGYLLHHILSRIIGPVRQVSWGVLYPLIQRLEKEKFIQMSGKDGNRKVYCITEAGKEQFFRLMDEKTTYNSDTKDYFDIKFANLHHVSKEQQEQVYEDYREYLGYLQEHYDLGMQIVKKIPVTSEKERKSIQRTLHHRAHFVSSEISWLENQLSELQDEEESEDKK